MKKRSVPGYYNLMVVCSSCDRDATQTQFSYYCVDAVTQKHYKCDECRRNDSDRTSM